MATIQLNGRITEDGALDIELPPGLPQGEARVTIEIPIELPWRPEELDRALKVVPMTGADIVSAGLTGGWSNTEISSGLEWVEERRRQRREERRIR